MAWTDQCKFDACAQIDHKKKAESLGAKKAIRVLSKESGIPIRTLESWYWPGEKVAQKPALNKPDTTRLDACAISDLDTLIKEKIKFGTIYADPPWQYSNQGSENSTDLQYSTLTIPEIKNLPIESLALDKAHLHLWTTNAFIFECPKIIEAWGFNYKSMLVWCKSGLGMGNYWRVTHEFLITAVRGNLVFADHAQKSWFESKRTKHSTKPERVAGMIEKVSPGPYLELFGRRTRENWTVWGNEIERTLFNEAAFGT